MFKPKRNDGRSLWRVIHDDISERMDANRIAVGDLITHADLKALTGQEPARYHAAVRRAGRELIKHRSRALQACPGMGYRIIGGSDQVKQSKGHKTKARRSIGRALVVARGVDRSLVPVDQRAHLDRYTGVLVDLQTVLRMHDEKINALGASLRDMQTARIEDKRAQTATAEEVAELRRLVDQIAARV